MKRNILPTFPPIPRLGDHVTCAGKLKKTRKVIFAIIELLIVTAQANFSLEFLARGMIQPLVAPFSALTQMYGFYYGNDYPDDQDDHRPCGPPFQVHSFLDMESIDQTTISHLVRDDVTNYLENLSPLALTMKELDRNAFHSTSNGDFQGHTRQVSANYWSSLKDQFSFFYRSLHTVRTINYVFFILCRKKKGKSQRLLFETERWRTKDT